MFNEPFQSTEDIIELNEELEKSPAKLIEFVCIYHFMLLRPRETTLSWEVHMLGK